MRLQNNWDLNYYYILYEMMNQFHNLSIMLNYQNNNNNTAQRLLRSYLP